MIPDEAVEAAVPEKSFGTSRKLGISPDVEVPIVKTGKPTITVVEQITKGPYRSQA